MQEKFANYQIGVDINRKLPKLCCEVTVRLTEDLSRIQGWKKKTFICRAREFLSGKILRPIHASSVDIEIIEWNHAEKKNPEIKLNGLQIKLFKVA